MNLNKIIELHDLAKKEGSKYIRKRNAYERIAHVHGKHFLGIIGPRGVGKTVLLRQYALAHEDAFYLSADTLTHQHDLWELVKKLHQDFGYNTFLLDEIHFIPKITTVLKRLYDFLDIHVIFTSSVALAMHESVHDLSRRMVLEKLYPFSYREYLAFKHDVIIEPLTFSDLIDRHWSSSHLRYGIYFDDYLRGGLLPFSLAEPDPLLLLANTLDKIIHQDIPSIQRLAIEEIVIIKQLLKFTGLSEIDGINYSSISKNLGITKYKAEQYVRCLEQAFVLIQIFPTGTNVLREPKIVMAPPYRLLYRDFEQAAGGLREDYFALAAHQADIKFSYLKSTRGKKTPDFLVQTNTEKLAIEIGGSSKGREQFKGIKVDRKLVFAHTDVPDKNRYPLFLLGYLV